MQCPKCQSEVKFKEGTSKKGNPYAGNFCTNKECDYVEWQESKPQPTNSDIIEAIRKVLHKLDKLEKNLVKDQEHNVPINQEDIPIIDEPLDSDEQ